MVGMVRGNVYFGYCSTHLQCRKEWMEFVSLVVFNHFYKFQVQIEKYLFTYLPESDIYLNINIKHRIDREKGKWTRIY